MNKSNSSPRISKQRSDNPQKCVRNDVTTKGGEKVKFNKLLRKTLPKADKSVDIPPGKLPLIQQPPLFTCYIRGGNHHSLIANIMKKKKSWSSSNAPNGKLNFIWDCLSKCQTSHFEYARNNDCVVNHLEGNECLASKKGLHFLLKEYCEKNNIDSVSFLPRTFYFGEETNRSEELKINRVLEFLEYKEHKNADDTGDSSLRRHTIDLSTTSDRSIEKSPSNGRHSPAHVSRKQKVDNSIWILKPATEANRGIGIKIVQGKEKVLHFVDKPLQYKLIDRKTKKLTEVAPDGWIVQRYIERPLLVKGRKFDVRCFILVTINSDSSNKKLMTGYFYKDCYLRTTGIPYNLNNIEDKEKHLTNDAIQKYGKNYGKFECGNKLSLEEWERTIKEDCKRSRNNKDMVNDVVIPKIESVCRHTLDAAKENLLKTKVGNSFELFGYDFMITEKFEPILLEVNHNPCLDTSVPLLYNIIVPMLESMIQIAVVPQTSVPAKRNIRHDTKFKEIFVS